MSIAPYHRSHEYRFCLNIGWLFTRLVAFNSFDTEVPVWHVENGSEHPCESTSLLSPAQNYVNHSIIEFMAM